MIKILINGYFTNFFFYNKICKFFQALEDEPTNFVRLRPIVPANNYEKVAIAQIKIYGC
jgi:hypothetical protein